MLKREKIAELVSVDMTFLDDKMDSALLGYVERSGRNKYILPCYGYQAIKAILRRDGAYGADLYAEMRLLFSKIHSWSMPAVLFKMKHDELWKTINSRKLPRWDGLDAAIVGLGKIGDHRPVGVMYNVPLCVHCLSMNSTDGSNGSNSTINAMRKLTENIIPVSLGDYTPWFLTPVK